MKIRKIICWLLVIVCMGTIFFLSAQPAEKSSSVSGNVITRVFGVFMPSFKKLDINQKTDKVDKSQHSVRKIAHFLIYSALGFLSFIAINNYKLNKKLKPLIALLITSLYASSDEIHQKFVPGRSCELKDVGIDTLGGIVGILFAILLVFVLAKIIDKRRSAKA